jgi:hypothetical protein
MQESMQSNALQECIQGMTGVSGIYGAALLDPAGEFLAVKLPVPYEPVLLSSMLGHLSALQELLASVDGAAQMKSFLARYEEFVIMVRWTDRYSVVLLASPTINLAMLSVAVHAAQMRIEAALSQAKMGGSLLRTYPTNPGTATESGLGPPVPRDGNTAAREITGARTGNTTTREAIPAVPEGNTLAREGQTVSDPLWRSSTMPPGSSAEFVPRDTVKALVKVLAKYAGPMAEAMIKRELSGRGVTSTTLRRTQFSEFLDALAQQIPKPKTRADFLAEASKMLV